MPHAFGGPLGKGEIRRDPEDFRVTEVLPFSPSGSGEHLYVRVRKRGQNTRWVAQQLARIAHLPYRSVSYAGLKDRHAVTEQWFSLQLAGREAPALAEQMPADVELLQTIRHERKLRQGQVEANAFAIVVRECGGLDATALASRIENLTVNGMPNYFGPQRFGIGGGNLRLALRFAELDRSERSFALSALRGALFNAYLAERIKAGTWQTVLPGEIAISGRPRGSAEAGSAPGEARGAAGLLWGQGGKSAGKRALPGEQEFFARFPAIAGLLEHAGARASRRLLGVVPADMGWSLSDEGLRIRFSLPAGCFATVLLRELLDLRDHASMLRQA
jgi:tRNA pseudouridine13 synthase